MTTYFGRDAHVSAAREHGNQSNDAEVINCTALLTVEKEMQGRAESPTDGLCLRSP